MTLENLLETFDPGLKVSRNSQSNLNPGEIEAVQTKSFETGYSSGWEDAQQSDAQARTRVAAEFERNIQNLVFTYAEAVDCVRGELKSFVSSVITGFLPEIVPELTREHVRTELLKLADDCVEAPVEIVASPDSIAMLEDLLSGDISIEIKLVEDETLASMQVYVRIEEREVEINVNPLIESLRQQLQAVIAPDQERTVNG